MSCEGRLVNGILASADLAIEWARFASHVSGPEGSRLAARMEDYFSSREIGLIAAFYGANALRAYARMLHSRAADEPTDPDIEIEIGPLPDK